MQPFSARGPVRARVGTAIVLAALLAPVLQRGAVTAAHAAAPVQSVASEIDSSDVYVVSGAGDLIHVDPRTTPTSAQLFNIAGESLGITWGGWMAAAGQAEAHENGSAQHQETMVRVELTGLIPHGVYSLFYATFGPDSSNPACPGVERLLPLTSVDPGQQPDAASFVADAAGQARFTARVAGRLLDAQQVLITAIYHADGHTYGDVPNVGEYRTQGANCRSSFGDDALRQLVILQQQP